MIVRGAIGQGLLKIARWRWSRVFLGWVMSHISFVIPVERLVETESLMAFYHPRPSYNVHILIVPKRPFHSLVDVPLDADDFLRDVLATVQVLVRRHSLEEKGYRLIVNGGDYQDVPHLHFHLVAD